MKNYRIVQIAGIIISLGGIFYMGYSDGAGEESDWGFWIVLLGLIVTIIGQFIKSKADKNQT